MMHTIPKIRTGFLTKMLTILVLTVLFSACNSSNKGEYSKPSLVDSESTETVKELHERLRLISKKGFAIGHQDATSYGIGWLHSDNPEIIKSDVNEVVGKFPAVYGFDIGSIEHDDKKNLDEVPFDTMRKLIIDAHNKGGIITISWHVDNPTSGGDSWDKTPAVSDILKGGQYHQKYQEWIKRVADFLKSLKSDSEEVPVVFRPFHEMNGAWFWWGDPNCTASDYIKLLQETITLLRDTHNVHNVLYAYSPNKLNPEDDYMKYYPGDDFVDILGIDIYDFNKADDYIKSVVNDLRVVKRIASEKNKLFAFTETGLEKIPTDKWFTEVLYPNIENSGIAWILFWRNARVEHHYMPYKGHAIEKDFIEFEKLSKTLFLDDIRKVKN